MGFEDDYQTFLKHHQGQRKGESLRRLDEGHGQAEKMFLEFVWWPLFHHFEYLQPEFEVHDFKDGTRYLDFAYLRPGIRLCIEIDGFGPHLKHVSRWQFADNLDRQNQLVIDRWTVLRFSFDQLKEHPRRCQQMIQQLIGVKLGEELDHLPLSYIEKEVVRYVMKKSRSSSAC